MIHKRVLAIYFHPFLIEIKKVKSSVLKSDWIIVIHKFYGV